MERCYPSPRSSWPLRVSKCVKNIGNFQFLTHERTHMLATNMWDVAIFTRTSSYKSCEKVTCLQSHLSHFGWRNNQKTKGKSSFSLTNASVCKLWTWGRSEYSKGYRVTYFKKRLHVSDVILATSGGEIFKKRRENCVFH